MSRRVILASLILFIALTACKAAAPETTQTVQVTNTDAMTRTITLTPTVTLTPSITPTEAPIIDPPAGIVFRTGYINYSRYQTERGGQITTLYEPEEGEYWRSTSPDGSAILVMNTVGQTLIDVETGEETQIWPREDYNLCWFSWVNRKPPVLFNVLLSGGSDPGYACDHGSPVLLSLDGELTVFDEEATGRSAPKVSRDGNFIAYNMKGDPYLYDWEQGSHPLDMAAFGFIDAEDFYFLYPSWSPSSKKLAWVYYSKDWDENGIIIVDFETNTYNSYGPYSIYAYEGSTPVMRWNQPETYIALWYWDGERDGFVDDMLDIEKGQLRPLGGSFEDWSPHGELYTIRKYDEIDSRWDLYVESPDSSNSDLLCDNCAGWNSIWSPDGTHIVTQSNEKSFWLIDIATGDIQQFLLPEDARLLWWADE